MNKLAHLARIKLSGEEKQRFQKEIGAVLDYVAQLKKAPVLETSLPSALGPPRRTKLLRKDKNSHKTGKFSKELLNEAPKTEKGFIKVKKILND